MKKIYCLFLFLSTLNLVSQYNPDAPWMQNLGKLNGSANMSQIKDAFNLYWETHDRTFKGSGFKPFMRWVNFHENQLHDDGTVMTNDELLQIYNQKTLAQNSKTSSVTSNWQPVFGALPYSNTGSSSPGQGRVEAIAVDPNNANIIYVGAPSGGLWKSINAGVNFIPLFDNFPQIGVSGIAIDPNNSDTIYITTGDRDHLDTTFIGVYKSVDGGVNWNNTGSIFGGSTASDIYVNPSNSSMIWVATSSGVFKSIDAGTSWSLTLSGNIKDIKIKPTDPSVIYAVSNTAFYKSNDFGTTFTIITSGLPTTSGRLVIDVTPANPNYVYVLSVNTSFGYQGIYKSINSGTNFNISTNTTNIIETNQAYYDLALAVSDTNPEEIYTGCLNIWKSTNGGNSFTVMNNANYSPLSLSYTHADIHILRFFGTKLYCGSDGGIYVSANGGISFTDLSKTIQIGTINKLSVAKQTSSKMMTGQQDNGGQAFNTNQWKVFYGSDGTDVAIDPTNSNLFYGFVQFGATLFKTINAGTTQSNATASAPIAETGTNDLGGSWITPLEMNSIGELFAGYSKVYKLVGGAWTQQSIGTVGNGDIDVIAIDPSNDNNIYLGNGNELYKSTDGGIHFLLTYTALAYISDICVHSSNSSIIYLVTAGTSGQALKSTDGAASFSNIASGLPAIGKFCIKHQAFNSNNPLYLGTNLGVYYIDDTISSWIPFDTNLPNVKVTALEINYIDNNITAATYGRGVWRSPITTTLGTSEFQFQNVTIYPNPSKGLYTIDLGEIKPVKIEIIDVLGKIMSTQVNFQKDETIKLNLTPFLNGIYFVKITTDKYSTVKKLIKNQ